MSTTTELKPCPECTNPYLAIRNDIYKDKREFVYCDCCGCVAPKSIWNRIAAHGEPSNHIEDVRGMVQAGSAEQVGDLSDDEIVKVLHSLGIDTYPSKYGFPELQVSATNVPMIRRIVATYLAALQHTAPAPSKAGEWTDEQHQAIERAADTLDDLGAPINAKELRALLSSAPAQAGSAESEREAQLVAMPLDACPPADQAFYRFWYGHMKNDMMTGVLANVEHATARYIWDAALSAQCQQSEDAK